jgi:hypothetical protein
MAGKNYGTMSQGYYYDESMTNIHYNLNVTGGPCFIGVAYHSKGQLIQQLLADGYKKSDIQVERWDTNKASITNIEVK